MEIVLFYYTDENSTDYPITDSQKEIDSDVKVELKGAFLYINDRKVVQIPPVP